MKVTSHSWGGSVYAIGYSDDTVVMAVIAFADKLRALYMEALKDGFPQFDPSSGHEPEGFMPGFDG